MGNLTRRVTVLLYELKADLNVYLAGRGLESRVHP